MRRLLLVSSSVVHGTGYLEHCDTEIRGLLDGVEVLTFVPFALFDHPGYASKARERFAEIGIGLASLHEAEDPVEAVERAEALFIGGGNTFRLLRRMQDLKIMDPIRRRVAGGMPYLGTSAGSNVACASIKTTNDMPIVEPVSFEALRLVPFQLNPHYLDPDPDSSHMGETRDRRLKEFLEENATPVVAIREGAMLSVEGDTMTLAGERGGKLFTRGAPPEELLPGCRLDSLLKS